ncbi:MAG: SLC13 family permease [Syntrophales bacterium]|jgi:di/tricarboxylate transporter|nr:SLC13 family permease [Syntrophales bacterium]MDY0043447.1 SLC13 family permease [Syntrophales bacterium]
MTVQIILVFFVLFVTIFLIISDLLRVDIIAIGIMVVLPWLGLITPQDTFSGLASNAVVAIIAVMILGYGVDRSGVINRLTHFIVSAARNSERRMVTIITPLAGLVSAFMQNSGIMALFLPALLRISKRTGLPASRLLIPVSFAVLLGGNITMIGSAPLIILNDLLRQGGHEGFSLFAVAPAGLVLLAAGIPYFLFFTAKVLPGGKKKTQNEQQRLIEIWHLPSTIYQCMIPSKSPLVGMTRGEVHIRAKYRLNLLALAQGNDIHYAPWRQTVFAAGQRMALLGDKEDLDQFVHDYGLMYKQDKKPFENLETDEYTGFAELIIPVRASVIGKTLRDLGIRKTFGVEPIMLLSGESEERKNFSDVKLNAGNALIVHGRWRHIRAMADNINFVLITPVNAAEEKEKPKPVTALLCFLGAIILSVSGFPIALGLLTGALAMIVFGVVPIDEAYRAISWQTVFLLAGLIPLGIAMDESGASHYVAAKFLTAIEGCDQIFVLFAVGILSTFFSLVISNVAATVLLVPMAMATAEMSGMAPQGIALLVALCASNSFLLPTHQVNALILSPGGYKTADFLKAGSILTVLFITISVCFVYLYYM